MPLSDDPKVNVTADQLVKGLRGAFHTPREFRAAHARGKLVGGTFTPSAEAGNLSKAPHFNHPVPLIVRFSSSTGLPQIPDTDPNGMPRGMAVRFVLSEDGHRHTDIVFHSTKAFPARTGEEFLEVLAAIGDGSIGEYLDAHPAAARFVNEPKPFPISFGTLAYFGLHAFRLVPETGRETIVRYLIEPVAGVHTLSAEEVAQKSSTYLFDELEEHLSTSPVEFKLLAQIAEAGDPTNDVTKHWPESRKKVELGIIKLEESVVEPQDAREQKRIIFDPIPRVDGVDASDDPLLEIRAAVYLIGGKERRAAPVVSAAAVA
ncbi:hypothetical protein LTR78_010085 [Recurvomyces mirabilis]|uniref:Catalase core domain-containing protein n=1 Tax=Recurvomyces mirabilis TaxID=574656 RepID=A0AAE0TNJ3_9PEZI|nr:hypothetical protein LTR78_010085 [Recurvomyces mirabilis]KAK5159809.1 hypothetical protein LTS14_001914 [Recurvomyces mirabilis]